MESILQSLVRQENWEQFLAHRLLKGRYTWHAFREADAYVASKQYLEVADRLLRGEGLGIPRKKTVNKMGTGKKRTVYSFPPEETAVPCRKGRWSGRPAASWPGPRRLLSWRMSI